MTGKWKDVPAGVDAMIYVNYVLNALKSHPALVFDSGSNSFGLANQPQAPSTGMLLPRQMVVPPKKVIIPGRCSYVCLVPHIVAVRTR